jgi:hypothetical protein
VHANAWQLHQEGSLLGPRRKAALADQLCFDLFDQWLEAVQDAQVVPHAELFRRWQVQAFPPAPVGWSERLASRRKEIVREQHRP